MSVTLLKLSSEQLQLDIITLHRGVVVNLVSKGIVHHPAYFTNQRSPSRRVARGLKMMSITNLLHQRVNSKGVRCYRLRPIRQL